MTRVRVIRLETISQIRLIVVVELVENTFSGRKNSLLSMDAGSERFSKKVGQTVGLEPAVNEAMWQGTIWIVTQYVVFTSLRSFFQLLYTFS